MIGSHGEADHDLSMFASTNVALTPSRVASEAVFIVCIALEENAVLDWSVCHDSLYLASL
jgi:hypothetical protein